MTKTYPSIPSDQFIAFSLKEAEERTGIKADTLKKRIRSGKLHAIKVGKSWIISPLTMRALEAEIE